MLNKIIKSLIWITCFELIGYLLGLMTQDSISTWYQSLNKSSLTPPSAVFPIVWSILYAAIALSGLSLWEHRKEPKAKTALVFYSLQMILNWSWSPLFFNFHLIGWSFYCIILIVFFTLITILIGKHQFRFSSVMLIPYFLWSIFASYLNGVLWLLN